MEEENPGVSGGLENLGPSDIDPEGQSSQATFVTLNPLIQERGCS